MIVIVELGHTVMEHRTVGRQMLLVQLQLSVRPACQLLGQRFVVSLLMDVAIGM